ncbi:transposase [Streptomyces klenkii]|uniref:transposase n=1 Tax=Streptomyces klenkii TaxID=1420899 RepID=UPI0033B45170
MGRGLHRRPHPARRAHCPRCQGERAHGPLCRPPYARTWRPRTTVACPKAPRGRQADPHPPRRPERAGQDPTQRAHQPLLGPGHRPHPGARVRRDYSSTRQGEDRLDPWLASAENSAIPELSSFADSLRRDINAVRNGLTMPWNSGVVEGHVNRIKTLKRQMFGRAGHRLLRHRILLA